jgi:peptidoglycan hydrolase-like protein with peptidoglycan-binding domain
MTTPLPKFNLWTHGPRAFAERDRIRALIPMITQPRHQSLAEGIKAVVVEARSIAETIEPALLEQRKAKARQLLGLDVLRLGDEGEAVYRAQYQLKSLGYAVKPDGDFGQETKDAVRSFQGASGLDPDGEIGTETSVALDRAVATSAGVATSPSVERLIADAEKAIKK